MEVRGPVRELPRDMEQHLLRIAQEAVTNVLKHAQASQVWVDLSTEDDFINLTVQDNGIGFSEEESKSNGIGLTGLRERITIAGGMLNINSTPKLGTVLSAQFPRSNPVHSKEAS